MTDDPREILKAAGEKCAEVDAWYGPWTYSEEVDISAASEKGDAAILALARLLAALKAQRCETCKWWDLVSGPVPDGPRFHHACVKMDDQGRVYFPPDFCCNRWAERGTK